MCMHFYALRIRPELSTSIDAEIFLYRCHGLVGRLFFTCAS